MIWTPSLLNVCSAASTRRWCQNTGQTDRVVRIVTAACSALGEDYDDNIWLGTLHTSANYVVRMYRAWCEDVTRADGVRMWRRWLRDVERLIRWCGEDGVRMWQGWGENGVDGARIWYGWSETVWRWREDVTRMWRGVFGEDGARMVWWYGEGEWIWWGCMVWGCGEDDLRIAGGVRIWWECDKDVERMGWRGGEDVA